MTDLARLAFEIDSTQVVNATGLLEGMRRAVKATREEERGLSNEADRTSNATRRQARETRTLGNETRETVGILRQFRGVLTAIVGASIIRSLMNTTMTLQRMRMGFLSVLGSMDAVEEEMNFVRTEADRLGQEFLTVGGAYAKLTAASIPAGVSLEEVRNIFTGVTAATTAMGLSAQESEGAFLAITQMMAKGRVQAEELRGQLAERIPSAVALMARGLGLSIQELNANLDRGLIDARTAVNALANEMRAMYEPMVTNSQLAARSVNEIENAFARLQERIINSGFQNALVGVLQGLTDLIATPGVTAFAEALGAAFNQITAQTQGQASIFKQLIDLMSSPIWGQFASAVLEIANQLDLVKILILGLIGRTGLLLMLSLVGQLTSIWQGLTRAIAVFRGTAAATAITLGTLKTALRGMFPLLLVGAFVGAIYDMVYGINEAQAAAEDYNNALMRWGDNIDNARESLRRMTAEQRETERAVIETSINAQTAALTAAREQIVQQYTIAVNEMVSEVERQVGGMTLDTQNASVALTQALQGAAQGFPQLSADYLPNQFAGDIAGLLRGVIGTFQAGPLRDMIATVPADVASTATSAELQTAINNLENLKSLLEALDNPIEATAEATDDATVAMSRLGGAIAGIWTELRKKEPLAEFRDALQSLDSAVESDLQAALQARAEALVASGDVLSIDNEELEALREGLALNQRMVETLQERRRVVSDIHAQWSDVLENIEGRYNQDPTNQGIIVSLQEARRYVNQYAAEFDALSLAISDAGGRVDEFKSKLDELSETQARIAAQRLEDTTEAAEEMDRVLRRLISGALSDFDEELAGMITAQDQLADRVGVVSEAIGRGLLPMLGDQSAQLTELSNLILNMGNDYLTSVSMMEDAAERDRLAAFYIVQSSDLVIAALNQMGLEGEEFLTIFNQVMGVIRETAKAAAKGVAPTAITRGGGGGGGNDLADAIREITDLFDEVDRLEARAGASGNGRRALIDIEQTQRAEEVLRNFADAMGMATDNMAAIEERAGYTREQLVELFERERIASATIELNQWVAETEDAIAVANRMAEAYAGNNESIRDATIATDAYARAVELGLEADQEAVALIEQKTRALQDAADAQQLASQAFDIRNNIGFFSESQGLVGLSGQQLAEETAALSARYDMMRRNIDVNTEAAQSVIELSRQEAGLEYQTRQLQDVADGIGSAFTTAFKDIVLGAKDANEALSNMLLSLADLFFQYSVFPIIGKQLGGLLDFGGLFGGGAKLTQSAMGNVFSNGSITRFGLGDVFGDMFTKPTFFPMANGGIGEAGESGPEGIFPLTRMSDGELGVRASGFGGGGGVTLINAPNIKIEAGDVGNQNEQEALAKNLSARIRREMEGMIEERLHDAQRPGGTLNPHWNAA